METARFKAFLAAAETGSFSKAAEQLCYTPSGVSQLVNALEDELGLELLRRSTRGVTLTANGEALLTAVRDLLSQEERLRQLSDELKGLATGRITIASLSSISTHWLPGVIREFLADYPQIQITLMEGIEQEVSGWLDQHVADMAFMSYVEPISWDWIPLAEDPMVAVLPRDHPLAGADRYPLEHCMKERFIMPALGRDADLTAMFRRNGYSPKIHFSTLENYAALAMVEQGLGMSIMNELITRNWQCDVVKLPLEPPQSITMGVAVPSLERAAPAVKQFLKYAVRRLTVSPQTER